MENKRNKFLIIGIVALAIVMITGVSYALWQITLQQETTNIVNTACFRINFTDENEINLQNTYPISDESGLKLEPYHFIIENICSTTATYQINLEELTTELRRLSNQYVKVSLNNSKGKLLNSYEEVTKTLNGADTSHKLTTGVLKASEIKEFNLRLWMDEDTPAISDVMNANFLSKITIIAVQKEGLPEVKIAAQDNLNEITVDISTVENPKNETLTYFYGLNEEEEIESESSIHTFSNLSDGKYKARGRAETLDGIILEEKELDVTIAYEQVYISNTGNDETGNGSIESPYASLQPAYNKVKSGGEMILLSDITATSTTNMDIENKEVTLRSNGNNAYSVFRGDSLTTQILLIENSNTVTFTNIIFDGREIETSATLIKANSSVLNLNEGTIIEKSKNNQGSLTQGGGLSVMNQSILNINGAIIRNNMAISTANAQGGGIHIADSVLVFNFGSITSNITQVTGPKQSGGGGGIFSWDSQSTINGGIISENSSLNGGGVYVTGGATTNNMTIYNVIIQNNTADVAGGGICVNQDDPAITKVVIKGGIIENNTSPGGPNTYAYKNAQIIDER